MSYNIDFEIREYECDLQDIVNNTHYQNYSDYVKGIYN